MSDLKKEPSPPPPAVAPVATVPPAHVIEHPRGPQAVEAQIAQALTDDVLDAAYEARSETIDAFYSNHGEAFSAAELAAAKLDPQGYAAMRAVLVAAVVPVIRERQTALRELIDEATYEAYNEGLTDGHPLNRVRKNALVNVRGDAYERIAKLLELAEPSDVGSVDTAPHQATRIGGE